MPYTPDLFKKENFTPGLFEDKTSQDVFTPDLFSEQPTDFSKMSKFGKVLDILGRPGYAYKSALSEAEDMLPHLSFKDGMHLEPANIPYSQKKIYEAAARGFIGKERITANELLERIGIQGIPGLGFVGEIGADPLAWGGGAGYKAITRTIGKGLGLAKQVPGVPKVLEFLGEKTKPVANHLKEWFVNKSGYKKLDEIITNTLNKRRYQSGLEYKYASKLTNIIQNTSQKYNMPIKDVQDSLNQLLELHPNGLPAESKVLPELKIMYNTIRSHFTSILGDEMRRGVPITALSRNDPYLGYLPRVQKSELAKYLNKAKIGNHKVWNKNIANQIERVTPKGLTLNEANDFLRKNGLGELSGSSLESFLTKHSAVGEVFETRTPQILYTRGLRSVKAITTADFYDDVAKTFGMDKQAGWEPVSEALTKVNPSLRGKVFHPDILKEIERVVPQYVDPMNSSKAIQIWDKVHNYWKLWTLAPFPKYHLRNMVGNMWNNYLAGVEFNQYGNARALQLWRKYRGTGGNMEKFANSQITAAGFSSKIADDLILQLEKTGVVGQGWFAADIDKGIVSELERRFTQLPLKGKLKQISTGRLVLNKGMAFGSTIENNARIAHYLDKVSKGHDSASAAMSVKKFLFDYQDLTYFEKSVMKRVMPFYTWTRKNIPLQLEQIWKQPQKFAPITHPLRNRDQKSLEQLKLTSPNVAERLPVELQRTQDSVTYIPLEGLIPAGDLSKLYQPQKIFTELISPMIRTPIEIIANKSFYFDSDIKKYDEETQELLKIDVPVQLKYLLVNAAPHARMLNEINKLVKKNIRGEKLNNAEKAFAVSLSSVYKMSLEDLKGIAEWKIKQEYEALKKGFYKAERDLRPEEAKRILRTVEKLEKSLERIK